MALTFKKSPLLKRFFVFLLTAVFFLTSSPLASAYDPIAEPMYDPVACDMFSDTTTDTGTPIGGNLQSLASQILGNHNIVFDYGISGPTATQFKRLANGQKAQTDNGREVNVQPIVLVVILQIAKGHKVQISALTDGSSHTAPTNPHGSGKAVDIDFLDGKGTNGSDAVANTIINIAAQVLPSGARFGMGNNPFGTKQINGKTFTSFSDFATHVHVDVLGVSQAADDAAVQAAGAGTTVDETTGSGNACCAASQGGSPLHGSGPGVQVFNFFIDKGLSNESAAAATGNLQLESAGWGYINKWGGGGGNYFGLGQWDRYIRYPRLVSFAGGNTNPDLITQLGFVWQELTTGYTSTLDNLKSNASLEDKTIFWGRHYEVAVNGDGSLQLQDRRIAYAQQWAHGAGDSTGQASDSNTGCGPSPTPGSSGSYTNPFHDMQNLTVSRVDEGVDYAAKPGSVVPVYAIGDGVVTKVANGNSTFYKPLPNWITYKLTGGKAAGRYVYVAEACVPKVQEKQIVHSDTLLCDAEPRSIETGWALDATSQAAAAVYVYTEGYPTAYGDNFNKLLVQLGAPAGRHDYNEVLGTLPPDWPRSF